MFTCGSSYFVESRNRFAETFLVIICCRLSSNSAESGKKVQHRISNILLWSLHTCVSACACAHTHKKKKMSNFLLEFLLKIICFNFSMINGKAKIRSCYLPIKPVQKAKSLGLKLSHPHSRMYSFWKRPITIILKFS